MNLQLRLVSHSLVSFTYRGQANLSIDTDVRVYTGFYGNHPARGKLPRVVVLLQMYGGRKVQNKPQI